MAWSANTDHRVVRATGADATRFLHDLLSQDIQGLEDGAVARCLLLAPNGRLRAVLTVARTAGAILLISEQSDTVLADLQRFRIRVDVELQPDARSARAVYGDGADLLGEAQVEMLEDRLVVRDPWRADRTLVFGDAPPSVIDLPVPSEEQLAAWRIEAGEPRFGVDIDESTVPNEAFDLPTAIDFTKGCYLGQELVERIDARGRIVKRLAGVVFDGEHRPSAPVALELDGAGIGTITSVAWSDRLGAAIGLGMIRSQAGPDAAVRATWDDQEATGRVRSLPLLTNS